MSSSSNDAPVRLSTDRDPGVLHSRTIEVLDQRGIAERFLSAGQVAQVVLDISDLPTRHNYGRLVDTRHDGGCELPVLGQVAAPPAVLIRPDGYVARVGNLTDPELPQAIVTWFGAATPAH